MGNISLEARSTRQAIKAEMEKWQVGGVCTVRCLWDGLMGKAIGEQTFLPG